MSSENSELTPSELRTQLSNIENTVTAIQASLQTARAANLVAQETQDSATPGQDSSSGEHGLCGAEDCGRCGETAHNIEVVAQGNLLDELEQAADWGGNPDLVDRLAGIHEAWKKNGRPKAGDSVDSLIGA